MLAIYMMIQKDAACKSNESQLKLDLQLSGIAGVWVATTGSVDPQVI
jgi:hypothetical protein